MPTTQPQVRPASKLTPGPIPKLIYKGLAKRIDPVASADLVKSFPANREAAYCGYDIGM